MQWTVGDWPVVKLTTTEDTRPPMSDSPHPLDVGKHTLSSPTPHPNMLTQHSSPSTSRKVKSSNHTPSLEQQIGSTNTTEPMEVDRSHPIAEPTALTHPPKRRKGNKKRASSIGKAGASNNPALAQEQHGQTDSNGKIREPLTNVQPDEAQSRTNSRQNSSTAGTPTRVDGYGMLAKNPEVRLTKVTTPTRQSLPNQFFPPGDQDSVRSSSREGQSLEGASVNRDQQELNSLWIEASSSQSQDQNFLPSFDSDLAFQQLSLSSVHQRHRQPKVPAQQQLSQKNYHRDGQQYGHTVEPHSKAPPLYPLPPPYQQPLAGGVNDVPPTSSQLQNPLSSSPHHVRQPNQSTQKHAQEKQQRTKTPQTYHKQRPPAVSEQQQQQGMDQVNLTQKLQLQKSSPDVTANAYQAHHRGQREREQHGLKQRGQQVDVASSSVQQQPQGSSEQRTQHTMSVMVGGYSSPTIGAHHQQSGDQQPLMNESLRIPTLHDLHTQQQQHTEQQQQQQRTRSPLGIPPFHQIQMHKSTAQHSESLDLSSSPNSQIFSPQKHIQNLTSPQLHSSQGAAMPTQRQHMNNPQRQQIQASGGSPHTNSSIVGHMSPMQQHLGTSSQHTQPQHMQMKSSVSPLHHQARLSPHLSHMQHGPQSLVQHQNLQHSLQGQQLLGGIQHEMLQQPNPKRHHQSVQNRDSVEESLLRATHSPVGQFLSPIHQQQHLSPQTVHTFSSSQQQQQAAILQQQQQHLLQMQQAQAAQRQLIMQQQQATAGGLLQNHGFLQSSTVQPYFGSANLVNATNKHLIPTHAQLSHPQLTHLSTLQPVGQDLDRTTVGGRLLSQQQQPHHLVMGVSPYASFGQGVQLLPNGSAAISGMSTGFPQPGQTMGSPLRHFHSQGR